MVMTPSVLKESLGYSRRYPARGLERELISRKKQAFLTTNLGCSIYYFISPERGKD